MLASHETLSEVKQNTDFLIRRIQARPETSLRLRELGLNEDTVIRVVASNAFQMICEVHNTRIGLHRSVAKHILVSHMQ